MPIINSLNPEMGVESTPNLYDFINLGVCIPSLSKECELVCKISYYANTFEYKHSFPRII